MSALTDARRREDAHEAAIERGKAKLRVLQSVLTHFAEGLSARESAGRLGVSARTVERHRSLLDLGLWVDAVVTERAG
jgi:FixJ family two-component response regulator